MKRFGLTILGAVAALFVLLLFTDLHLSHTADQLDSQQAIARAKGGAAPVGRTLSVYLTGDRTLAAELRQQLAAAIRAKDLPVEEVRFLNEIPVNSNESPFLAIRLDADQGFWTPVYATRHVTATLLYFQGRLINPDRIAAPGPGDNGVAFVDETCVGECTEARRQVQLRTTARGLVSLPNLRAHAANKVVAEAAILVAGGMPEYADPAKWSDRAFTLAKEKLKPEGPAFSTFQRLPGCRGGIALVGGIGAEADWSLIYYDAQRDAITETLTRSVLKTKVPELQQSGMPGFGANEAGVSIYLGNGKSLTIPAGTCGLSAWQVQ